MNIDLRNKQAVISGSTSGIGYAIARGLAAAGASVVINGRDQARIDEAVDKLHKDMLGLPNAQIRGVQADLSNAQGVAEFITQVPEADILINNFGIYDTKGFFDIADEEWERFFQVNVMSAVRLSRHYAPRMIKRGWGRIQFLSSSAALQTSAKEVHYGMSKTALLAISRGLAESLAGTGVTVNAVLPGPTATEGMVSYLEQVAGATAPLTVGAEAKIFQELQPSSLIERLITPEEVANLCVYLASVQASATTGAALRVDGGIVGSIL